MGVAQCIAKFTSHDPGVRSWCGVLRYPAQLDNLLSAPFPGHRGAEGVGQTPAWAEGAEHTRMVFRWYSSGRLGLPSLNFLQLAAAEVCAAARAGRCPPEGLQPRPTQIARSPPAPGDGRKG